MKKHNFGAGPGILPQSVIAEAAQAVQDFNHSGLSILEISHRSKDIIAVMDEAPYSHRIGYSTQQQVFAYYDK